MAIELSWLTAASAGVLSFFSPCILPLVLPYLCYMAGISIRDLRSRSETDKNAQIRKMLIPTAFSFVLGFTSVFVILGAGATAVGRLLLHWQEQIVVIAGFSIIVMGLNFLGKPRLLFLSREVRFHLKNKSNGSLGAFIMGIAFAFGWTPCIGPVLGLILTLSAKKESIIEGVIYLMFYSFGLGIPFILTALFSSSFTGFLNYFHGHLSMMEKIVGTLFVIAGILLLKDHIQHFSYHLFEILPILGKFG